MKSEYGRKRRREEISEENIGGGGGGIIEEISGGNMEGEGRAEKKYQKRIWKEE